MFFFGLVLFFRNRSPHVFGDLYLNGNAQLHIAFDQTYFSGGKLRTDPTPSADAVLSFGPQSKWEQLKSDSYVVGKVRIYHEGTFTFPIGSEDRFSPITFEAFQNTGFIQTQYTETPPALLTQFEVPFTPPLYHYWSWEITGEAIARLRAYWTEQHRLERLSFDSIDPTELQFGLYVNSTWQSVLGHHSSNHFLPDLPLSIAKRQHTSFGAYPFRDSQRTEFYCTQYPHRFKRKN